MNKPLILVVEDDGTVRNLITTTLKSNDYRFLTAPNGESAIAAFGPDNTVALLQNHGSVAMGATLWHAFDGVCAVEQAAQAAAADKVLPLLNEKESAVYRRGRNAKVNSVPHNASINQYHAATGLEALFGWLYLQGQTERISRLFGAIMEEE